MYAVKLIPHLAVNIATKREIDTGQDRIHLDGRHVGYVHRTPTSPIALIVTDLIDEQKQAIADAVREKYAGAVRAMPQPVEIPAEEYGSDDDDDTEDEYDYE